MVEVRLLLPILSLVFLLGIQLASAQPVSDLDLQPITEEDGLPSNTVFHVVQDREGFLWFATDNGIVRYDGAEFITFSSMQGLPEDIVLRLFPQENGALVGETKNNSFFVMKDGKVENLKVLNASLDTLIPKITLAQSFIVDRNRNLHFGMRHGSLVTTLTGQFLSSTFQFTIQAKTFQIHLTRNGDYVSCFSLKSTNHDSLHIYISTPDGKEELKTVKLTNMLSHYNSTTTPFASSNSRGDIAFNLTSKIFVVKEDTVLSYDFGTEMPIDVKYMDDNLWVGLLYGGVRRMEITGNRIWEKNHLLGKKSVTSSERSADGSYWFSTLESGVYKYSASMPEQIYANTSDQSLSAFFISEDTIILGYYNGDVEIANSTFRQNIANSIKSIDRVAGRIIVSNDTPYIFSGNMTVLDIIGFTKTDSVESTRYLRSYANDSILFYYSAGGVYLYDLYKEKYTTLFHIVGSDRIETAFATPDQILISTKYRILRSTENIEEFEELNEPRHDEIIDFFEFNHQIYGLTAHGHFYHIRDHRMEMLQVTDIVDLHRFYDVETFQDEILLSTSLGVYILHSDSFKRKLALSKFIPLPHVRKIRSDRNYVYLMTKKGIYRTSWKKPTDVLPRVHLNTTRITGTNENVRGYQQLSYHQNDLVFELSSIDYKTNKRYFRYSLLGHDKEYQTSSNNRIAYSSLPSGDFVFEYTSTSDGVNYSPPKQLHFSILPPVWKRSWFILLISAVLALLTSWLTYLRIRKLKRDLEIQETIARLKSQALVAQLNPHLVFNVLNSIQGLVSIKETEKANVYIARFSTFMRNSLNMSRVRTIPVREEIYLTRTYIQLEQLRFPDEITFEMDDYELTNAEIPVPPLIIQPLIENAIKHGIIPKMSVNGKIRIQIKNDESELVIRIIDNGLGYNSKTVKFGDGLTISGERLKVLNEGDYTIAELIIRHGN